MRYRLFPLFLAVFIVLFSTRAQAAPQPELGISADTPELLSEPVNLTLTFSNTSATATDTGFYPIVELTLPAELQLSAACATAISVTNPNGAPVSCQTFGGFGVAANSYTNPITGESISIQNNETLIIITAPTGTLAVGQPAISFQVGTTMTASAVVGTPFSARGRAIFALGDQADGTISACGGAGDTICQSPLATAAVTPVVMRLEKTTTPNVANATGPNYPRTFTITADVATGATVTAVTIADTIPDTLVITNPGAANDCTAFTPVPDSCSFTIDPNGGGSIAAVYNTVNGSAGNDISISYSGFIQEFNDDDGTTEIIPALTGNATSSDNTSTADFSYLGNPQAQLSDTATIAQRSVDTNKSGSVTTDNAPVGNSPGDRITWTITTWISDYFSFDDLIIDDDIQDGQTFVPGSFSVRVVENTDDITRTQAQLGAYVTVAAKDANGVTHIDFDLSGALSDAGVFNLNDRLDGDDSFSSGNATRVIITYQTDIDENFVDISGAGNTVVVDGGDDIVNDSDIDFRVFGTANRQDIDDTSATITVVPTSVITKVTEFENGGAPSDPLLVATGDTITYKVTVTIPTGDIENLVITDYLPTPVFSAADPDDDGVDENTLAQIAQGDAAPNAGEWRFTTTSTVTPAATVVGSADDNSIRFSFEDNIEDGGASNLQTLEILFTVQATDDPFTDGLALVNVLFVEYANSAAETSIRSLSAIADLETDSPNISVVKVANALVSSAGSINANNFTNVDSGDTLEFLVTITNDGREPAEDVTFSDAVPAGFVSPNGLGTGFALNVVDGGGAGTCLVGGISDDSTPTTVAFSGVRITEGGICNVTYRVLVDSSANFGDVISNTATVRYAQQPGGPTFSPESATATTSIEQVTVTKTYQNGTSSDPTTPDKELRPGESASFLIGVSVPEGSGGTFRIREVDNSSGNPSNNFFENLTSANVQFELPAAPGVAATIENDCSNGNPALFNFDGLEDVCFSNNPSLPGNQSQTNSTTYEINFGNLTNLNTTDGSTEVFHVVVTPTVAVGRTAGVYTNRGRAVYTSNQGTQTRTGTDTFTLVNPVLTIGKTSPTAQPVTIGDTIRYVISVQNTGDSPAYDVANLIDTLPTGLGNATLVSATYQGTDITGQAGFSFTPAGQTVTIAVRDTSNNPDIVDGESFVVTYDVTVQGTLVADATAGAGHPGGVIDGPGCVDSLANSADIASFETGDSGSGRTVTTIAAGSVTRTLDSDGDSVPNSVETVGNTCPDTDSDGVPDHLDTDSEDNAIGDMTEYAAGRDLDGNGTPDYRDLDNDGDGINDVTEGASGGGDSDGDGVADFEDPDSDNDGIPDSTEGTTDTDGDGVPNYLDLDSDNDGIPDVSESGGTDADQNGIVDGADADNDGIPDSVDPSQGGVALNPPNTDGLGGADYLDLDSDNDGLTDSFEAGGTDANGDGIIDGLTDLNGNGWDDATEAAPLAETDTDGDSTPDYQEVDSDADGITDSVEAQTDAGFVAPAGADTDGDGIDNAYDSDDGGTALTPVNTDGTGNPDFRDIDADDDGILDSAECVGGAPCTDTDGNAVPDYRDTDSDGDGIVDNIEAQTDGGFTAPTGVDTDGDGLDNAYDPDNGGAAVPLTNTDGNGPPDFRDLDSDDDGIPDATECDGGAPCTDTDGDGNTDFRDLDSDGDGIVDLLEAGGTDADGNGILDDVTDTDADGLSDLVDPDNGGTPVLLPDADGDGVQDFRETDSDDDGISDTSEAGGGAPSGVDTDGDGVDNAYDPDNGGTSLAGPDTDGDGVSDYADLDSDNDGILDSVECPGGAPCPDSDGDGIVDALDLDSDNDGIADVIEAGGTDDNGDGVIDGFVDANGNGLADGIDPAAGGTPLPNADTDSDGRRDYLDLDSDNDGLLDVTETGGTDANNDGILDAFVDADNDGLSDVVDTSAGGTRLPIPDTDSDGSPNFQDTDSDGDSIPDNREAQTDGGYIAPAGADTDMDGIDDAYDANNGGVALIPVNTDADPAVDYLDLDSDNDGVPDSIECESVAPCTDSDSDGMSDYRDRDADDDGIPDVIEAGGNDINGDGIIDGIVDSDGDGLADGIDPSEGGTPLDVPDSDGDGLRDFRDRDSDNDGISDIVEAGGTDADGNGIVDDRTDTNGDGLANVVDTDDGGTALSIPDTDGDGRRNYLDIDADGDGIVDNVEAQTDAGYLSPLGSDTDGDGLDDRYDTDNGGTAPVPVNTDMSDTPDYLDLDSDNDGRGDLLEGHDADIDGAADVSPLGTDSDNDGLDDAFDTVVNPAAGNPTGSNSPLPDTDSDGARNFRDVDDDGDGLDSDEEGDNDTDGDGRPDYGDPDLDGDGINDGDEPAGDTDGDGTPDLFDPACTISGSVITPQGEGLENVRVATADDALSTTTAADGSFSFPGVSDGTYRLRATLPDDTLVGVVDVTAEGSNCGQPIQIATRFILESPIYFVWNGFLEQFNVVVLTNKSEDQVINASVTMYDINGTVLHSVGLPIEPKSEIDLIINSFPGYSVDTYGYVRVTFDNPEFFDGHSAAYKFNSTGELIDFAIIKPFENVVSDTTYALFNTSQPSLDPLDSDNQTPQWAQIVNLNPSEWKLFTINLYDLVGELIQTESVIIPPFGRRDRQAGHENPGQKQVGLVEIIPRDTASPYLAQVYRYGMDAPAFVFTEDFSFATGVTSLRGLPFTLTAPVSNGAGAINWVAVANTSSEAGEVAVTITDNAGNSVLSTTLTVEGKGQRHINVDSLLPEGASGLARFSPSGETSIVAESVSYFLDGNGQVTAAGVSPGRLIFAGDYHVAYNSFLGQLNWLRLQNTRNRSVTLNLELFDTAGNSLASADITLAANTGRDVELLGTLGLPVPADSYGLLKISSDVPGAVFVTLLRIRGDGDGNVDISKPLPGR